MYYCSQPFERIEIYENGDVYNCCPPFINFYSIGNIFKTGFDEIWNGERAVNLRRRILKGDFSLCADFCNQKMQNECEVFDMPEIIDKYPSDISISSDNTCNVMCRICRDEPYKTAYNRDTIEEEIEKIWLPVFKDAELLRFGCSGEPFASFKETMLIKKSAEKYPDLKFHFHTNGILADEKKLKELGVFNKTDVITLSLHSASKEMYDKIVIGGNWDRVMNNLKLYSKMKKEGLIKRLRMIFAVYDENYKEMEKFAQLAAENNAIAEFWALRQIENTEIGRNFDKHSIINKNHPEHEALVKILKQPVFDTEYAVLYPELKALRQE